MQSDKQLDLSLLSTKAWTREPVTGRKSSEVKRFELPSLERGKLSFSGKERNHLFHNRSGSNFKDISGISGLDAIQDSRSFAVWDFDRDGCQDIALLNVNTPVLSLYRNQLRMPGIADYEPGNMVALNFVGGNVTAKASNEFSSRDGYGVKVTVVLPDKRIIREHRCGEGLAAQNSSTMLIGIGDCEMVKNIIVDWPSGISQQLEDVPAGQLVIAYECSERSSDASGFDQSRYILESQVVSAPMANEFERTKFSPTEKPTAELGMYTSMATWCNNCKKQLPQLKRLRNYFPQEQLSMLAVPVDLKDTDEKLSAYVEDNLPPYELNAVWSKSQRENFSGIINEHFGLDLLPATIITDQKGQVLAIFRGVPSVSETARVLSNLSSREPEKTE